MMRIELGTDGFLAVERRPRPRDLTSSDLTKNAEEEEVYAPEYLPRALRFHLDHQGEILLHPLLKRMRAMRASLVRGGSGTSTPPRRPTPPPSFHVVSEKTVINVGRFTLFSNGKAVARFDDRTIVDVDADGDGVARVMLPTGETRRVNLLPTVSSPSPLLSLSSPLNVPALPPSSSTPPSAFAPNLEAPLARYLRYTQAFIRSAVSTPQERRESLEMRRAAEATVAECRDMIVSLLETAASAGAPSSFTAS